jgi:hypothetical protein
MPMNGRALSRDLWSDIGTRLCGGGTGVVLQGTTCADLAYVNLGLPVRNPYRPGGLRSGRFLGQLPDGA